MRSLSFLGLIAFIAAWLLSGVANAEELYGAPGPLLDARAYADYRYQPESEWAMEQVTVAGGEPLTIDVDGWGAATLTLRVEGALADWPARTLEVLHALRTTAEGERTVRELDGFLSRLDHAAQLRGDGWIRCELCRDGSLPSDDGCGLETGGGFSAEVSTRDGALEVVLTDAP